LITLVPTNSYYLRTLSADSWAQEHPIRQMARAGLKIHPNTDDPAFHLVDPIKCQRMMIEAFGYGIDDLKNFMLNGLEGSWLDHTTKSNLSKQWSEEFDEQRQKYL
jgi:adenosine deaminase